MKHLRNAFISALLLFSSTFASLIIGEFAVRTFAPQNLNGSWRVQNDKGLLVNASTGTVRHQFISDNRNATYHFYEPHLRDTEIRELGIKVLVLGDSFTFGWLIDGEDTYVHQLQKYADEELGLGKYQFLNAAAGGWGTSDYVAFVEDYGKNINPKVVLIFLNTDDIGRSLKSNLFSVDESQMTLRRNVLKINQLRVILNHLPIYKWMLERSHLVQLLRKALVGRNIRRSEINLRPGSFDFQGSKQEAVLLGQLLFERLNKWCNENNAQLLVTTTGWHASGNLKSQNEPTIAFMEQAPDYFKSQKIPFYDISSDCRAVPLFPDNFIIPGDGHPNESGHKLIADFAWNRFIKERLSKMAAKG